MRVTTAILPPAETPGRLDGSLTGLSEAEAQRRRAAGQGNDVEIPAGHTYWDIFRRNAFSVLYFVLIAVAALLVAVGLPIDALVTAGAIVVYVGVGVAQEVRAKQQLDRIALLVVPRVRLIRDGTERDAAPSEVVVGDLLHLKAGDQVPLDGRIVEGELEVDESLLTGESEYLPRTAGRPLLSGSVVGAGRATYLVEKVGLDSYANRLLVEARRYRDEATPLQRDVSRATAFIVTLAVLLSIPVGVSFLRSPGGIGSPDAIQAAAVLVGLVPQGLAMMIMVTYTLGALRLARRGALVQRLAAIEAMSRVDTLFLDKTGTITSRRMELVAVVPSASSDGGEALLRRIAGQVAASASVESPSTEAIARALAGEARDYLEEIPFRSSRRWSAMRLAGEDAGCFVLGAPEALRGAIERAATTSSFPAVQAAALASRGLRVLLLARAPSDALLRDEAGEARLPESLVPLGLLALSEEIRPQAAATLRAFAESGVELRVLSGDDPATVGAIAAEVGLPGAEAPVHGAALAELNDADLTAAAQRATVIGRIDPDLKARVIRAVRHAGRFTGMIGDGVNDIVALKQSQLGIAMGSGTSAARGVSDLVLLNDDFDVLPSVVIEGRRIVVAMQATLYLLLTRTGYMLLLLLAAAVFGLVFPFTPRTNAAQALTTVGIPTIVISVWVRPAKAPRHLLRSTAAFAAPAALAVALLALPVYLFYLPTSVAIARSAITTITVLCGIGLLTLLPGGEPGGNAMREPVRSQQRLWILIAAMLGLYLLILWVPLFRGLFDLAPMELRDLAILAGAATGWTALLHLARRSRMRRVVVAGLNRLRRGGRAQPS